MTLEQDGVTTRTFTVRNDGDEALSFVLRISTGAGVGLEPGGGEIVAAEEQTPNAPGPAPDPLLVPYVEYGGDHLRFGISSYGEIMPYEYPLGNEHLRVGVHLLAGYTLAWRIGGVENLAYAAFYNRSPSLTPVSYQELENSALRLRVRAVTATTDGALRITRTFDFTKSSKHIDIDTNVENVSASEVTALVLG